MKIAVIGSRGFNDYNLIEQTLNKVESISKIISGGANGADTLAEQYANKNNIEILIFKPDYKKYNRGAPLKRNLQIIDSADIIFAFWDGESKGTLHAINYARKSGKEVNIISYNIKN